ncbi:MAG: phage major capsid protein [Deltaproteobacteria bacterium]|nr:phage major capsid protein [Deltaproteobacteria bacterium]
MKKQLKELGIQYRDFEINRAIDEEKRTVELSFSSEEPVERFFGFEILDHSTKSVIMNRLKNAAAFLLDHNREKQIGVIDSAKIGQDKRGSAVVRFSKSALGDEIFQDVKDGIRKLISVGYRIHDAVLEKESKDEGNTYRVTKWEPLEISLVSIPADVTVGIGRDEGDILPVNIINKINERNHNMTPEEKKILEDETRAQVLADEKDKQAKIEADKQAELAREKIIADTRTSEESRVKEIIAIGENFGMRDDALKAINAGTSIQNFQTSALKKLEGQKHIDTNTNNLGMHEKEIKNYSLTRAIEAQINGNWDKAGLEFECSREWEKKSGKEARGFYVPHDVLVNMHLLGGQRDVTKAGAPALVGTDHLASSFIDLLRNKSAVMGMGALSLYGLVGDVSIPKQTGASTAYWINAEGGTATESTPTFGALTLTPKTISGRVDISRRMRLQSNPGIEALVLYDIAQVLYLGLDLAAIAGTGSSGQPTGLLNTSGIGDVIGTSIGWPGIVELETDVAAANGDIGSMSYLCNATVRGLLKTREKSSNTAKYLCENNEVNGYPLKASNQVPASTLAFGVWSAILLGFWSGLDIELDKSTLVTSGGLSIFAFQDADVGIRQAAAFSASNEVD